MNISMATFVLNGWDSLPDEYWRDWSEITLISISWGSGSIYAAEFALFHLNVVDFLQQY